MKTICCAFHRKYTRRCKKGRVEIIGTARTTQKRKRALSPSDFSFDYNEREALRVCESLDEKERKS